VAAAEPEIPLVAVPVPPFDRSVPKRTPDQAAQPLVAPVVPARASTTVASGSLRLLHRQAADRYAGIDSYIARLTRREQVHGRDKPEEVMLFKFRKQPWSVHFKWLSGDGQGREVIFVKGCYENKLHTLLAAGDIPLTPAGKRIALAPDSVMVRSASRHPITEAGFGSSIVRFGRLLDAQDRGERRAGTLTDLGLQHRPEFSRAVPAVEHRVPSGVEEDLPQGGRRDYYFDPESHLPLLIVTHDNQGHEVEYYLYDRIQYNVGLDDNDFNPDKLWGPPRSDKVTR
jgi:hypothetical protein